MRKVRIDSFEGLGEAIGLDAKHREKLCDAPDCAEAGEFRAPKSPDDLQSYHWFCLDHVREYNKAWNFYAGLSEREIEAQIRHDTTWQRPTWPFGARADWRGHKPEEHFEDTFGVFEDGPSAQKNGRGFRLPPTPLTAEEQALTVLDLDLSSDKAAIKARYKELVKLHHPDANGGDKTAEERLKAINEAYSTLKNSAAF